MKTARTAARAKNRMSATARYSDDESLVNACLEGKEDAWLVFQDRYTRLIFSIAGRPMWRFSRQDVEDLCEEIFVKLIETGLRQFQFKCSLKNYVATIAKRACLDLSRSRAAGRGPDLSFEQDTISGRTFEQALESGIHVADQVLSKETAAEIKYAFDNLPEECRLVLRLRYGEEMSYDQIAAFLNKSLGTVCSQVSRCMNRLTDGIRGFVKLPGARPAKRKR